MTSLNRLLCSTLAVVALLVAGWFGVRHYGAEQQKAGYAAAVAAGKEQHDRDAAAARQVEQSLRAKLAAKDFEAHEMERTYEISLDVAQRRLRAGDDRLRCPAGPVPAATAPGDRPAAGGPDADNEGPTIVPEVAAEILGDAADVAGLVRRYGRVVERFDACREMNAK